MIKAKDFITYNPPQPETRAHLVVHMDKRDILLSPLIGSISKEIRFLFVPRNEQPTPLKIVRDVQEHLDSLQTEHHEFLKFLVDNTVPTADMPITKYHR